MAPVSWDDLKEEFLATQRSYGQFEFQELKKLIAINFLQMGDVFDTQTLPIASLADNSVLIRCNISARNGNKLMEAETIANNRIYKSISRSHNDN